MKGKKVGIAGLLDAIKVVKAWLFLYLIFVFSLMLVLNLDPQALYQWSDLYRSYRNVFKS